MMFDHLPAAHGTIVLVVKPLYGHVKPAGHGSQRPREPSGPYEPLGQLVQFSSVAVAVPGALYLPVGQGWSKRVKLSVKVEGHA